MGQDGNCVSRPEDSQIRAQSAIPDMYRTYAELEDALHKASVESIQCVFGFDFSKSNEWTGTKTYAGKSLHDCSYVNPYIHALQVMAPIIPKFDDDGILPAFRFGCTESRDKTVIPLAAPQSQDCHFRGIEALKMAYIEATEFVAMSGPTTFAPMINKAIEISAAYEHKELIFLVLMTDGDVSNIDLDRESIIKASNYPISICALGFGDGPFDLMREFDDMPGRKFDNFQFVNFTLLEQEAQRLENPDLTLCTAMMQEIPAQVRLMKQGGVL